MVDEEESSGLVSYENNLFVILYCLVFYFQPPPVTLGAKPMQLV